MDTEDSENSEDLDSGDDEMEDLFDSMVDREARRVLFDLLNITYHYVRCYKAAQFKGIIDIVAAKFEVLNSMFLSLNLQTTNI